MSRGYQTTYVAISVFLVGLGSVAFAGHVIYVDASAIGASNGSSWTDAYSHLQDALIDANSMPKPVEIRVARGIYTPDEGAGATRGDQMATFQLVSGVTLRGGYAGFSEPDPDARDTTLYATTLSGDLAGDDVHLGVDHPRSIKCTCEDNSCRIVTGSGIGEDAIIDGFTVAGGDWLWSGCTRDCNDYAGVYIESGRPTIVNCRFIGTLAFNQGALVNCDGSRTTLIGCTFAGNDRAIANTGSSLLLTKCAFESDDERAIYSFGVGHIVLTECTFKGPGISSHGTDLTLAGCTFSNSGMGCYDCNSTLTSCTFQNAGIGCTQGNLTVTDCGFVNSDYCPLESREGSLVLTRCLFSANSAREGGAVNIRSSGARLYQCTFKRNTATAGAGAIDATSANLVLQNCIFSGNQGPIHIQGAGAVSIFMGNLTATGCIFAGNSARGFMSPGAISSSGALVRLSNCTFAGNWSSRGQGNAIRHSSQSFACQLKLSNCIVWDGAGSIAGMIPSEQARVCITYSNVQGGWPGEGNIDADPCFAEPGYWVDANDPNVIVEPNNPNAVWIDGDYHLQSQAGRWDPQMQQWVRDDRSSPCIDAGDRGTPIGPEPFPNGGVINMGAYGGTIEASKSYFGEPICGTIVAGDINGDCKVDCSDFAILASHWLLRGSDFINIPPTVTIVAPPNGAEFHYPTPITICADATDIDGSVVWLRFTMSYKSNGRSHSSGYSAAEEGGRWWYDWYWWGDTGIPFDGNYTITAKASDDDCAVSVSAPVVVTLHVP